MGKHAIIDVGSNSLHLTVYQVDGSRFKPLFRTKVMAGLAGYVERGRLSAEGICAAEEALLEFRRTLDILSIQHVSVFATASLRNIENAREAVAQLQHTTGFSVEIVSGAEEARLSYCGAMLDLDIHSGAFVDIGGASTEVVTFDRGKIAASHSCRIGSLSLYKKYVGKILPGPKALEGMERAVQAALADLGTLQWDPRSPLVCVGGTARTVLKLARKKYALAPECRTVSAAEVDELLALLCSKDRRMLRLLLRTEPDRVHTIVPGLCILHRVMHLFQSEEIVISQYGVREGFLCQKIIQSSPATMPLPRTGR